MWGERNRKEKEGEGGGRNERREQSLEEQGREKEGRREWRRGRREEERRGRGSTPLPLAVLPSVFSRGPAGLGVGEATLQGGWSLRFHLSEDKTMSCPQRPLASTVGTELFTLGVFNSRHSLPVPSKESCCVHTGR